MVTTRRGFLKAAAAGGVAVSTSWSIPMTAAAASGGAVAPPPWNYYPYPVVQGLGDPRFSDPKNPNVPSPPNGPQYQILHTTLMRVSERLASRGPIDKFYLWAWTHDLPILRLWSAPNVNGTFTYRGDATLPALPAGYDRSHFSSGDIAWDPDTNLFYACPHSRLANTPQDPTRYQFQDTFLISSADGLHWDHVGTEVRPIIAHDPDITKLDGRNATYGRFMRNVYGDLARHNGKIAIFYRGEHPDPAKPDFPAPPEPQIDRSQRFYLLAATADGPQSPNTWAKYAGNGSLPIFFVTRPDGFQGELFGVGSVIYTPTGGGQVTFCYSVLNGTTTTMRQKVSTQAGNPFASWSESPGAQMFTDAIPVPIADGPSIVEDGTSQIATWAEAYYTRANGQPTMTMRAGIGLGYAGV